MFSHTLPNGFTRKPEPIPSCLVELSKSIRYNQKDDYTLRRRRDSAEISRHIHQARSRGATILEEVSPGALFGRDEGTCRLCNEPILKGFSMDHIVSVIKGGQHTWANTQSAHHGCNSRKG